MKGKILSPNWTVVNLERLFTSEKFGYFVLLEDKFGTIRD